MPQLTQLRLCCIGPAMARIDDLILPFYDANGQATNSTLWLRNGGGKTFIMQLLLWLMCPDKKKTQTDRSIEDYVQSQDRSVIVAEWQLDGSSRRRAPSETNRYLTGVFCEWRAQGEQLERLFFVARVQPNEQRLTLEGLPVYALENDRMKRRTLASFKHEWQALGNANPSAEINETETLHTWHRLLEQAGIDPKLFSYQMKMNIREGGAEELFKFKDADRFVDFFLELITDTAIGDTTAQTIEKFRTAFQQQTEQFQPEQQLLSHLIEQLEPLRDAADEREQMYHSVQQAEQALHSCDQVVSQNLVHLQQDKLQVEQQRDEASNAAQCLHVETQQKYQRAAILSYAAAQKQEQRLKNELTLLQELVKTAQLNEHIWRAARPLRDVIRAEQRVTMLQERLINQQKEHEPLFNKVQESACAYAAALNAKLEQLHEQKNQWLQTRDKARKQAHGAQTEDADKQSTASKFETEAKHVNEYLTSFYKKRTELEAAGVLLSGEEYSQAQNRLNHQHAQLITNIQTILQTIKRIEQDKKTIRVNISQCEKEKMQAATEEKIVCRQLNEMQKERKDIEADSRLQQYLELETIDLDRIDQSVLNQLQDAEHELENRLIELHLALLEHETIIAYLTTHHLLPPTKDVESTLKVLRQCDIIAWSGWEFIHKSVRESDARAMLQRMPELAFGVVVRDEHFQKAQDLLREGAPHLDTLVVVAPQEATQRDTPLPLFVIGPTSDAHFNSHAGEQELSAQQSRHDQTQKKCVEQRNEKNNLHTSTEKLRHFFQTYPLHQQYEWLAKQDEMATRQADFQTRIKKLQDMYQELEERSERDEQLRNVKNTALNDVNKHLSQLQAHEEVLTIHPDDLKQQHHHLLSEVSRLRHEASRLREKATELEQQAEIAVAHITSNAVETRDVTKAYDMIRSYLNGSPKPCAGDIQRLQDLYQQLLTEYEQKIGVNEITAKLEDARKDMQNKRSTLSTCLQGTISEAMVREAIEALSDLNEAEDRYLKAIETRTNAQRDLESGKASLIKASQIILDTRDACIKLNIPEGVWNENVPEGEESCRYKAEEVRQQAQFAEGEARKREQEAQKLVEQMSQLDKKIHRLENEQSIIKNLLEKYQTLFQVSASCTIPIESVSIMIDDDDSMQPELQKLRDILDGEQKRLQRLEQKRNEVTLAINRLMNEVVIKYPKVTMVHQFLNRYAAEHYERECNRLLDQWALRKQQVETALANTGEFRQLTISHMLELADNGIELLKRVAKRSKLPPSLPEFQQQPFLKIILKDVLTVDERRAKIDDLLERCMKEGTIPSGLALLQRAVRCLASPIKVEMLFPDPNHLRYVPVAEVAKESGGERLTSFVLLYCSLVQLRATERAKHTDASSILILDNPYGAASRSMFLELQREVAQSMRIQLIYTTGIHDIEAIRVISNVIRLRNDSMDRKTGEQLLQLDTPHQGLQSMRVILPTTQDTLQQSGYEQ